jgi:hypothetical protein
MEYHPNTMPNEGVDVVSVLASVLTEKTKAEPSLRKLIFSAMENFSTTTTHSGQTSNIVLLCGILILIYTMCLFFGMIS